MLEEVGMRSIFIQLPFLTPFIVFPLGISPVMLYS